MAPKEDQHAHFTRLSPVRQRTCGHRFAHSDDDKPYSQRAAAKDGGEVEMSMENKDLGILGRLGYAGRGDVVLGEGRSWHHREPEQRRKHSATSSLTNHMVV